MKIFRWIAVAFSMYSKIPMPVFEWKEDDMSYGLAFFPLVGIVIGIPVVLLNALAPFNNLPVAVRIIVTLLIPLIITGGFHADGFMDTEDALNSYSPAEKKLEILKDPNIGAFAVISLLKWMLAYAAALTALLLNEKNDLRILIVLGGGFVVSRSLSGLTSVLLRKAKKNGMLYEETRHKNKAVTVMLVIWMISAGAAMIYASPVCGTAVILTFILYTLYYRYRVYKEFGGVTGDTAGFFLTTAEILSATVLAVIVYVL